ncbi:MAG: GAF domain-containing protein [Desulfobacterota bacterium]|nr:GAF domain-containing protein [Thermodesulfobacteriota bacterium]
MSSHPHGYDLLKTALTLYGSSLSTETKVETLLRSIQETFPAEKAIFMAPERIPQGGLLSWIASRGVPLWVDAMRPLLGKSLLPEERDLLCPSFGCIPLTDKGLFKGIFYIGFREHRTFSPAEMELLLLLSESIRMILRDHQFGRLVEETSSELSALQEMGKALTSTLKPEDLFGLILTTGQKILKARGGALRIEETGTGRLKIVRQMGAFHQTSFDERIARRVHFSRMPLCLSRKGRGKAFQSLLCVPLISEGRSFGTLSFYDKDSEPSRFDAGDLQLLLAMASQMSCAIKNAMTHQEIAAMARDHERNVGKLSTLMELSKALLTTVHFDRIVHMTLTAVTLGDGLGFNRAMLFLVNDKERVLEGTMAVGPDSPEEAGQVWAALSQWKGSPSELLTQLRPLKDPPSGLHALVKGIRISLEHEQCILCRTVLEGRPFNIRSSEDEGKWLQTRCERGCQLSTEVGCYVSEQLSREPKVYSFATVPLWGKGRVIGVILVDNLYNRNPITDEDIRYLTMFSNQAGLAIENALLYRKLEEVHRELKETQTFLVHQEKMAALGELSASIAHEIRNPLVSIGGFARRLERSLSPQASEKKYAQTIMREVERVEKILSHILTYTQEEPVVLKALDLREVMEESLSMMAEELRSEGLQLTKEYADPLPKVKGDYYQLKQAFYNLISNAYESMNGKGRLSIRIHPFHQNGAPSVRVEVEDTGAGIPPESLHHIFNPFYSTKENRLGLGLPILHKVVTFHHGQIEVNNHPGKGVVFLLTFPAQQE